MKKHTKAAVSAAAAAVLLLGGAGTLAYWSDSAPIGGVEITTGSLSLANPTSTGWVYAQGNANEAEPVTMIVPGDTIAQQHTFTINAKGDNVLAEFDAPTTIEAKITSGGTPTTITLPVTVTYTVDGQPAPAQITSANDGDLVVATVTVSFPFGDETTVNANDTQDIVASLDDLTIQLTQVQAPRG